MKIFCLIGIVAMTLCANTGWGAATNETSKPVQLPSKEKLRIYLLMGQSNMAGRGKVGTEDKTPHPRVIMLNTNNTWELAAEPVTKDRKTGLGVGPGLAFAKIMAEKNPDVIIGLVPCAVGGTPLSRWQRGGDLYSNAVARAKAAVKDGTLAGVLWHQGESDSSDKTLAESYGKRLGQMVQDFRADLGQTNLPFIAGQIGEFLYERGPDKTPFARTVNEALKQLPLTVPQTACVESHGLNHLGDKLHFNTESQHEFGQRYAAEMLRLQAEAK
jgi:Carbohydrate esterase, sialic acid-specific acetylesterase